MKIRNKKNNKVELTWDTYSRLLIYMLQSGGNSIEDAIRKRNGWNKRLNSK